MEKREGKICLNIEVDKQFAQRFKARCAEYGATMTSILRPAAEEYMRTHPPKIERKPLVD